MKTAIAARFSLTLAALGTAGCATTLVEPGHRGLYFAPNAGGLRREVLPPGKYHLGWCFLYCTPDRIDDFDVTYSTRSEEVHTKSVEGLELDLKLSIIYRPIVSELYQLDTEIGATYYDEVVSPEFRSACRGIFARHSYAELQKNSEAVEDEIEAEVRRRTAGKHIEINSITLESINYAPEIADKIRQKIAGEQEAARQKASIAWEAEKKKQILVAEAEQKKLEAVTSAEQQQLELAKEGETARFKAEQELAALETQKKVTRAEAEIERMRAQSAAEKKIIEAKADAEATRETARAHAEEQRAETAGVTPMEVMEHAYDALGHLGGTGTTIVLGDWAHVPSFLFPRVPSLQNAFMLPYGPYTPPAPAPAGPQTPTLSSTKPAVRGAASGDPY
jgi:regulator of protease activity HflC (stomatin/prohibitin superfamily)